MTREKARIISAMIWKEMTRWCLADLCEDWGVTIDEFESFLDLAVTAAKDTEGK